jgi:hypothetical protein
MLRTLRFVLITGMGAVALVSCKSSDSSPGDGGGDAGTLPMGCPMNQDDLISDFKTGSGLNPADGRQGGWYTYSDMSGQFGSPSGFDIDTSMGGPCSGVGSLHVKGTGFGIWGAAAGTDFKPRSPAGDAGEPPKMTYDASKYTGVAFWIRAAASLEGVQVSFPDLYTDGAAPLHEMVDPFDPTNMCSSCRCIYSPGSWQNCSPYLVQLAKKGDAGAAMAFSKYMDTTIDSTWRRIEILFADTRQDPGNAGYKGPGDTIAKAQLTAMAIQVNPNYDVMPTMARDFEIWIDDVAFVR